MIRIYLTESAELEKYISNLEAAEIFGGLLTMGYIMPVVSVNEEVAMDNLRKYCRKKIAENLKKCEFFAELSKKEEEEKSASHNVSYITKATTGMGYVLADEAESVLQELQRLNICETLQKALKTGKHVVIEI